MYIIMNQVVEIDDWPPQPILFLKAGVAEDLVASLSKIT